MKKEKFTPKKGQIVAWDMKTPMQIYNDLTKKLETKSYRTYTAIAVAMNEDEFSVCLNFRGRKDEETRLWEWDNFPYDTELRIASLPEMASLFTQLISQGYSFKAENGLLTVDITWAEDCNPTPEPAKPEPPVTKAPTINRPLTREERFHNYIVDLVKVYTRKRTLKGMSDIRNKHHISAIRRDVFFYSGLDSVDPDWLETTAGKQYTDDLYLYVLGNVISLPHVSQYRSK